MVIHRVAHVGKAPVATVMVVGGGIGGERLDIFFMSGSQAHAFAEAAQTMTDRIRALGPNPLKAKDEGGGMRAEVNELEDDVGYRGRH